MTESTVHVVILAAGKGTRMKSVPAQSAPQGERAADAVSRARHRALGQSHLDHRCIRSYGRYCAGRPPRRLVGEVRRAGTPTRDRPRLAASAAKAGRGHWRHPAAVRRRAVSIGGHGGRAAGPAPARPGGGHGADGGGRPAVRLRPHRAAGRRHRAHRRRTRRHAGRTRPHGNQRRHLRPGARTAARSDGRPGPPERAGRVLPARSDWHLSPARPGRLDAHGALGRRDSRHQQSPRARGGVTSRAQRKKRRAAGRRRHA